jgi:hypothetical protein
MIASSTNAVIVTGYAVGAPTPVVGKTLPLICTLCAPALCARASSSAIAGSVVHSRTAAAMRCRRLFMPLLSEFWSRRVIAALLCRVGCGGRCD